MYSVNLGVSIQISMITSGKGGQGDLENERESISVLFKSLYYVHIIL